MEMDSIIARLGEMASYCDTEIDAKACTEAVGILFALMDGGVRTVDEAKDLIHDYNALSKQYRAMYKRHGTAGHAVHKDGVWHCPDCNRRVHPYHAFCHSCGKKLDGGTPGKGGQRHG